jgi:hypothetical protein
MKKSIFLSAICTVAFWSPVIHAAEPYAPKVDVPENADKNSLSVMVINAATVPDKSAVGIPSYPGARVFQTKGASEMQANDKTLKTFPYIKLLSTDPPDKIVAWYRNQLEGYTYEDVFGVAWVFWKGEEKFNGMDIRQRMTVENVGISEAIAAMGFDEVMQGTQSIIEIAYDPE